MQMRKMNRVFENAGITQGRKPVKKIPNYTAQNYDQPYRA